MGGKPLAETLWVKNDGAPSAALPEYGGNKVRKLEQILPAAIRLGARRVVTAGAAGSHHVLATTLFARRLGLKTAAFLWPQVHSEPAELTLLAGLEAGLEAHPVGSVLGALVGLARARDPNDFVIAIGGAGLPGTLAYVDAVAELAGQLQRGELPAPERIVVAAGTGTTAAGLLAGVVLHGLEARVVGVLVARNPVARPMILSAAARALVVRGAARKVPRLQRHLELDGGRVGGGYGRATPEGERALRAALRLGLTLDATYTAKAFGRALAEARAQEFSTRTAPSPLERPRLTLYWHTLSTAPLGPLLGARGQRKIPRDLAPLFHRPG